MIRATRVSQPVRALLGLATLGLAPGLAFAQFAPAPRPEEIKSFAPRAEAVFVQQNTDDEAAGDTAVIVQLSGETAEDLKKATGRYDLFAVGQSGAQIVFRDDGNEGDAAAGDLHYTALAHIDVQDLADRAEADGDASIRGESSGVPVFAGRAAVGTVSVGSFDIDRFNAGAMVEVELGIGISPTAGSPSEEEGAETEGLVAVTDDVVVLGTNQFQERVLMIRNPLVVADATRTWDPCTSTGTQMGPWTFGHLMTEMANQTASGINPSTFVENWLNHWLANQTINTFNVPQRLNVQAIINDWRAASGGGALNLGIAPFRLLAINPRVDLRTTVGGGGGGYGGGGTGIFLDGGEARFTFGFVVPPSFGQSQLTFSGNPIGGNGCKATRFSVIMEFRVPKCSCEGVRDWAKSWIRLNTLVPGTVAYNSHLESLTRTFTDRNAHPARPNRSAIGQVRTNEIAIQAPWEIREFQLRMMPWSMLLETTTADTPHDSFNNTNTFGNFVLATLAGTTGPAVPLNFPLGLIPPAPFLGGNPQSPNLNTFWNAPNLNVVAIPAHDQGRFAASLGTCNGCHNRETNTVFVHIDPNTGGLPANLSGFLTGITVTDPAGSGTIREFDDLARRETDIRATARMICGHFHPILARNVRFGLLRSNGDLVPIDAASSVETDPEAQPVSLAIEDFLREPVQQVH
jgi:hypothetical protein